MNQLNKYVYLLLAVAIILAAAFGYMLKGALTKPEIIKTEIPVLVPGKDSVIGKTIIIRDSSKQVAELKTDTAKTTFNSLHIFGDDSLKHKADITYLFSENSFVYEPEFDLIKTNHIRVDTLKLKETKIVNECDPGFFEEPYVNYLLGVLTSIVLYFLGSGI
jgi:hypothetical protein